MSLSVLHYSGLSLISLLDSLSGSYSTVNLSSFPETETVCQSVLSIISTPCVKFLILNASALSNPDSLTIPLTSDTLPNTTLKSLVDSGSSDSFIDSAFVQTQHLSAYNIPPIKLHLIDGTSNSIISQALDLKIQFPTGEFQNLTFYVTSVGPELHDCTRIPLTHPLQSLD